VPQCPIAGDANDCIIRRNRPCSANDSAYSYALLRDVVCLSVVCLSVCHIRAACLNQWTDLTAVWHVCLWGCSTSTEGKGKCELELPATACSCKLQPSHQSCAATWQIQIDCCSETGRSLRLHSNRLQRSRSPAAGHTQGDQEPLGQLCADLGSTQETARWVGHISDLLSPKQACVSP